MTSLLTTSSKTCCCCCCCCFCCCWLFRSAVSPRHCSVVLVLAAAVVFCCYFMTRLGALPLCLCMHSSYRCLPVCLERRCCCPREIRRSPCSSTQRDMRAGPRRCTQMRSLCAKFGLLRGGFSSQACEQFASSSASQNSVYQNEGKKTPAPIRFEPVSVRSTKFSCLTHSATTAKWYTKVKRLSHSAATVGRKIPPPDRTRTRDRVNLAP